MKAEKNDTPGPLDPAVIARMEQWLGDRNHGADRLITLYDVTGRNELLQEAADKHANHAPTCLAMIRHLRDKPQEALPWIERFLGLESGNAESHFLKNWALAKLGDHSGGLNALRHAASRWRTRNTHLTHRSNFVYQAAQAAGLDESVSSQLSFSSPPARGGFSLAFQGFHATCRKEIQSTKAISDADLRHDTASLVITLIPDFVHNCGTRTEDELQALSLELEALSLLPDDATIGNPGTTVAQIRTITLQCHDEARRMHLAHEETATLLAHATEAVKQSYRDAFYIRGETAAALSLRNVTATPPFSGLPVISPAKTNAAPEGR